MELKATLVQDRESKNMVRYEVKEGDGRLVGMVYVSKEALTSPFPRELEMTVRTATAQAKAAE